jgi:hypothetical protein
MNFIDKLKKEFPLMFDAFIEWAVMNFKPYQESIEKSAKGFENMPFTLQEGVLNAFLRDKGVIINHDYQGVGEGHICSFRFDRVIYETNSGSHIRRTKAGEDDFITYEDAMQEAMTEGFRLLEKRAVMEKV